MSTSQGSTSMVGGKGHAVPEWLPSCIATCLVPDLRLPVVLGKQWVWGYGLGLCPSREHSTVGSCSLGPPGRPLPLPLPLPVPAPAPAPAPAPPEAVRVSYGQAAATAAEGWPAALEFPPTNNFYKPPAS